MKLECTFYYKLGSWESLRKRQVCGWEGEWPEGNVNCAEIWLSAGKRFQSDFIQIVSSQVAIVLHLSDLSPFPRPGHTAGLHLPGSRWELCSPGWAWPPGLPSGRWGSLEKLSRLICNHWPLVKNVAQLPRGHCCKVSFHPLILRAAKRKAQLGRQGRACLSLWPAASDQAGLGLSRLLCG